MRQCEWTLFFYVSGKISGIDFKTHTTAKILSFMRRILLVFDVIKFHLIILLLMWDNSVLRSLENKLRKKNLSLEKFLRTAYSDRSRLVKHLHEYRNIYMCVDDIYTYINKLTKWNGREKEALRKVTFQ